MLSREQFYKSKKWEAFRKVIIDQRTTADGYIHCAICNKPILKPYDLIVHHKIELSDDNVNDAIIALNPDNVECVHFRCHNQIHERFGFNKAVVKKVFIVYGSPCAGKSTWVHDNATADDLIVDMDSIWQMISINDRYQKPAALKSVVFEMRDKLYDIIKYRSGKWNNAYVIIGGALQGDRDRLKARIGADDMVFIDTPKEICLERAQNRGVREGWTQFVNDWFNSYQKQEENGEI